jgi:hypothetical protein
MAHDTSAPFQHDLRIDQGVIPEAPERVKRLPLPNCGWQSPGERRGPAVVELVALWRIPACGKHIREEKVAPKLANGLNILAKIEAHQFGIGLAPLLWRAV